MQLLSVLRVDQVHVFGASLGGFLAQKLAQATVKAPRVRSLILCNAFTDTSIFKSLPKPGVLKMLPGFALKRLLLNNFPSGSLAQNVADSVDFMVERLEAATRQQVASRLALNSANGYVEPQAISKQDIKITVLHVLEKTVLRDDIYDEMIKCFPEAKTAHLRSGGNFPYLACEDEVNMHIKIHLRQFEGTRFSASSEGPTGPGAGAGTGAGAAGEGEGDVGGNTATAATADEAITATTASEATTPVTQAIATAKNGDGKENGDAS